MIKRLRRLLDTAAFAIFILTRATHVEAELWVDDPYRGARRKLRQHSGADENEVACFLLDLPRFGNCAEEISDGGDVEFAIRRAVVHWYDHGGIELLDDGDRLGGSDGEVAADRDEEHIHGLQLPNLLFGKNLAEVTQVAQRDPCLLPSVDGDVASCLELWRSPVRGKNTLDNQRPNAHLAAALYDRLALALHCAYVAVVEVLVSGQDRICLPLGHSVSDCLVERVYHHREASVVFDCEARVAMIQNGYTFGLGRSHGCRLLPLRASSKG
jgi:hypothetical protein